jgi:predicted metal-dependent hydrolase
LASLSLYKRLDYIIQIDAPFKSREDRVFKRDDNIFKKGMMVIRDKEFKNSLSKRTKGIDQKVNNNGSIEKLQQIADEIYLREIEPKMQNKQKGLKEKYGGYKVKSIKLEKMREYNKLKQNEKSDDNQR